MNNMKKINNNMSAILLLFILRCKTKYLTYNFITIWYEINHLNNEKKNTKQRFLKPSKQQSCNINHLYF